MKKTLFALIALGGVLALSACNKQDTPQDGRLVPVRFTFTAADNGRFPTKAIGDEIAATLPATLDLTLTAANGKTYQVQTGQEILLPAGEYAVTGNHTPTPVQYITKPSRYTSFTPAVYINESVTITEGVESYQLTAIYGSFAVGVLPGEVTAWTAIFQGAAAEVQSIHAEEVWLVFVTGNLTSTAQTFDTTITGLAGDSQEFVLHTSDTMTNGIRAEWGKWYLLHPGGAAYQTGALSVTYPEWVSGL